MTLRPSLEILPAAQRALWPELAQVPRTFVLYGGTALALRLAHRESIDFDLFSHDQLDRAALLAAVPFTRTAATLHESVDTWIMRVDRGAPVKISFFGSIRFGRVGVPDDTDDHVLRVASVLDLAGTKIKALLQRVESKDYRDVAALLAHGVPLPDILGAAATLFGPTFNPLVARKALAWFEGGDLGDLEPTLRDRLTEIASNSIDVTALPLLDQRLD